MAKKASVLSDVHIRKRKHIGAAKTASYLISHFQSTPLDFSELKNNRFVTAPFYLTSFPEHPAYPLQLRKFCVY